MVIVSEVEDSEISRLVVSVHRTGMQHQQIAAANLERFLPHQMQRLAAQHQNQFRKRMRMEALLRMLLRNLFHIKGNPVRPAVSRQI